MGKIITFEGINGTGKTTCAKEVASRLEAEGHKVKFVRLPQPGPIREALLDPNLPKYTKFFLYVADMAEFYANLDPDTIYILDRSYFSTIVYQTRDGINADLIERSLMFANVYVDHCLLLTCDPAEAKARREKDATKDGGNPGGFSDRDVDYYAALADDYDKVVNLNLTEENISVVDTTGNTVEETIEASYAAVLAALNPSTL